MHAIFEQYGIELLEQESEKFAQFLALFIEYNTHTNLSAIRQRDAIIEKHFVDSLMLSGAVEDISGKILDIGTGGGFPGIPLAITYPNAHFTLLDSVGKKTRACEHFVHELALGNVEVVNGRAEEIARESRYKKSFDVVLSRATAYLPEILGYAAPFLKPEGRIFLYKTPSDDEYFDGRRALESLSLEEGNVFEYTLAGQERQILEFIKNS